MSSEPRLLDMDAWDLAAPLPEFDWTMPLQTMQKTVFAILAAAAVTLVCALGAAATSQDKPPFAKRDYWMPEWMMREPGGPGPMSPTMTARMLRHAEFLNFGVPAAYQDVHSPIKDDPQAIAEGRSLYQSHCARCHGEDGLGDGDTGKALSPSPAVLAYMITQPISVDRYLMWSISEGGKKFGSKMPAFKDQLTRDDLWEIIAYMRAGFPPVDMKLPPPETQDPYR